MTITKTKPSLAIVIPAYKATFLDEALESISRQTCQDFHLYIGDDCSPYNLKEIIDRYNNKIKFTYKRFDSNLGGKDLVAQWERCIDMIRDENWIWLFSDDDMMSPQCVESFYNHQRKNPQNHLYHFDIEIINEDNKIIQRCKPFPKILSSIDFFKLRATNKISSFVVEYIFNKENYEKTGKFQNFDFAWGSDHATWIKLGYENNIVSLKEGKVLWRKSSLNISPNRSNEKLSIRKVEASSEYYLWVKVFFSNHGIKLADQLLIKSFINDIKNYNTIVPLKIMFSTSIKFLVNFHFLFRLYFLPLLFLHRFYKKYLRF